jgi:hypothetical protein
MFFLSYIGKWRSLNQDVTYACTTKNLKYWHRYLKITRRFFSKALGSSFDTRSHGFSLLPAVRLSWVVQASTLTNIRLSFSKPSASTISWSSGTLYFLIGCLDGCVGVPPSLVDIRIKSLRRELCSTLLSFSDY